ncbi:MAG: hypothetical protein AVDCRST_MAG40-2919, partial [uncultured Gemmatimonadaceae bacterium]
QDVPQGQYGAHVRGGGEGQGAARDHRRGAGRCGRRRGERGRV